MAGAQIGKTIRLNDDEFLTLTAYLRDHFGIDLRKKRTMIEGRMNGYLINRGFAGYQSYLNALNADKSGNELGKVLDYLTTNYSYFMREQEHFKYFESQILPQMMQRIPDRDLRIWSAGCSTGEEPYTLAMILSEFFCGARPKWDTRVLATDISKKALDYAKRGVYDANAMQLVPARWRSNCFDRLPDGGYQAKEWLRDEVIFRRLNLIQDFFTFRKRFHVIFCRNVMIYFDAKTKETLLERLYESTEPGGYLIVGQSESMIRVPGGYSYVMPSIYRKDE